MSGDGQVGVAEPQVDDVGAGSTSLDLQRVDDREDVGRQRRDPAELHAAEGIGWPSAAPERLRSPRGERRQRCRAASSAAPIAPASEPSVGDHERGRGGRWPSASTASAKAARAGSSSRSAASASPPPTTTSSGSRRLTRLATPRAEPPGELVAARPGRRASPSRAAAARRARPGRPRGRRPAEADAAPARRPASAASRAEAPEAAAGRVALPAAPAAARAGRAVGVDHHVTGLAGEAVGPVLQRGRR